MLRFRKSFNGVEDLFFFNHGFRQLALYSTEVNPNFVNYLVENLGFSNQQAISTHSKFNRQRQRYKRVSDDELVENSDSVVAFLKKIGLEQSQIRNTIIRLPRMLLCNVDKTLIPKTEIFQKLGFSESDAAKVVSLNPAFILSGLNSTIVPGIEALLQIMGSERHVITVLKKLCVTHVAVIPKYLVPNVALLQSYGIPLCSIRKILLRTPAAFARTAEVLKDAVTIVEEKFGIPRNSTQFLDGVRVVTSLSSKTIDSKMQVYKSFGWTDSDIARLVRLTPGALAISQDSLKKKLDILMNELGYEPAYLASRYYLLSCSLEKRVIPRHKVLVILKEKGLIRKDYPLSRSIIYTESKFLKKFVLPFKEVHQVYSKHAGISMEILTLGLPESNSSAL